MKRAPFQKPKRKKTHLNGHAVCVKCRKEAVTREGGTCPTCLEFQFHSQLDTLQQKLRYVERSALPVGLEHQQEMRFEDPHQLKFPFDPADWLTKEHPLGAPPKPKIARMTFPEKQTKPKIKRLSF